MIEVGSLVKCVPLKPGTVLPARTEAAMRAWSSPKPPWTECSVEFGDVGVVEKLDEAFEPSMKLVKFFRWPDEEIWLSDMWLEEVDG